MNEQAKGYWKHGTTAKSYVRTCSVCGERSYFIGIGEYPFCPYCKAEMNPPNERAYTVKKYIDADALNEFLDSLLNYSEQEMQKALSEKTMVMERSRAVAVCAIKAHVEKMKTADVQEVRHGKWIWHFYDRRPQYSTKECSLCHNVEIIGGCNSYCPNCGAKMDGGE